MKSGRIRIDAGVAIFRRGRKWWIDIHRDGARRQESLETENRDYALVIAKEMAAEAISGTWNISLASAATFDRAVKRFQTEYEPMHHSEGTIEFTQRLFRRIGLYLRLRHKGPVTLDRVRREDIAAYQMRRSEMISHRGKKVSPATVNREIRELSTLWNWARSVGLTRVNPIKGIKPIRVTKQIPRILIPEDCEALVRHMSPLLAELTTCIGATGCRYGEISHLQAEDIHPTLPKVEIKSREAYPIKDREERVIDNVPESGMSILRRRKLAAGRRDAYVFITRNGTVMGARNALRDIKRAAIKAGLTNPHEVNWQVLRKSFATLNATGNGALALQKVLGHADSRTTAQFYVGMVKPNLTPLIGG